MVVQGSSVFNNQSCRVTAEAAARAKIPLVPLHQFVASLRRGQLPELEPPRPDHLILNSVEAMQVEDVNVDGHEGPMTTVCVPPLYGTLFMRQKLQNPTLDVLLFSMGSGGLRESL